MNNQPLIGLPCGKITNKAGVAAYDLKEAYVTALMKVGAIPLLIPIDLPLDSIDVLIDKFDGFLLSGGADVDPVLFGGEPNGRVYGINHQRDNFEICLVQSLARLNKPLFAICRGVQILNVALGGTLYTDIASQVHGARKHDWFPGYPRDRISHQVQPEDDSRLGQILGSSALGVNSLHHQSIKKAAESLIVNAVAPDGIIEGAELPGHTFMVGVQWHPECLQSDPRTMQLFSAFVNACCRD